MNIIVLESNIYSEEQLKYFTFFEYFNNPFRPFINYENNIHFDKCLTMAVNMTLNFCS